MALITAKKKVDATLADASKSNPDSRPKTQRSTDGRTTEHSAPRTRILERLMPVTRRVTYQFDTSEQADFVTRQFAFEEQNDREAAAECDLLIEQAIREQWLKSGFARFRTLRVEVAGGHVVLRGQVRCFYHEQMAHSLIRELKGVHSIDNEIQVKD